MEFDELVDRFVEQYLVPRGLPKDIFGFNIYDEDFGVDMPDGISVIYYNDNWSFDSWLHPGLCWSHGAIFQPDQLCDINSILDSIVEQRNKSKAQIELREKVAALEAENAKLRRKIEKLELRPGGKEYNAAKNHFDRLVEEQ
jgi:hypothetical protein